MFHVFQDFTLLDPLEVALDHSRISHNFELLFALDLEPRYQLKLKLNLESWSYEVRLTIRLIRNTLPPYGLPVK